MSDQVHLTDIQQGDLLVVLCLGELKLRWVDGEIEHLLMVVVAQFNDALLQAATSLCGHRHHVLHSQYHFLGDLLADLVNVGLFPYYNGVGQLCQGNLDD